MAPSNVPSIDVLLRLLPMPTASHDNRSGPQVLLETHLPAHPSLAGAADYNGYTPLHACASYASDSLKDSHRLLRVLVQQYHVDVNIADQEGDTPLFYAENPVVARILVEELGADWRKRNGEGVTAEENAEANAEDEEGSAAEGWRRVAEYLKSLRTGVSSRAEASGTSSVSMDAANGARGEPEKLHHPPPLPPGVSINLGAVRNADAIEGESAPDPEFRARIEALAARPDFQGEEGQAELRKLVEDAVGGLNGDSGIEDGGGGKRGRIE